MTTQSALADEFEGHLESFFPDGVPDDLVVACSGGGDSLALLDLTCRWAGRSETTVHAVTVDHGLREGSADEAAAAADTGASLGAVSTVLNWRGWRGQGNLQEAARDARRELLADYALNQNAAAVMLGHTLDDQAETFLMRLARGSGVEGLSCMARESSVQGVRFLRPLLAFRRAALRDHLRRRGIEWAEDPSNHDDRFDRARMRKLMPLLAENGLTADRLAGTSDALRGVAEVVAVRARDAAKCCVSLEHGDVVINRSGFASLEEDTRHRIFAHGLCWVSGNPLRPRLSALKSVLLEVLEGGRATLHGCLIYQDGAGFRLTREYAAVSKLEVSASEAWDGRWSANPVAKDTTIRALGAHGVELLEKTERDVPRSTLLATPSIWKNGRLIAVPFIGWGASITLTRNPDNSAFFSTLFSR